MTHLYAGKVVNTPAPQPWKQLHMITSSFHTKCVIATFHACRLERSTRSHANSDYILFICFVTCSLDCHRRKISASMTRLARAKLSRHRCRSRRSNSKTRFCAAPPPMCTTPFEGSRCGWVFFFFISKFFFSLQTRETKLNPPNAFTATTNRASMTFCEWIIRPIDSRQILVDWISERFHDL